MENQRFEEEFYPHLKKYLNEEEILKLKNALNQESIYSSFIIDQEKINKDTIEKLYPFIKPHDVVEGCYIYNKKEHEIGKSILFNLGAYYILEPCSSLVSYFLSPKEDDLVLDIASSPGGKTIHSSFLMNNKGLIIANEISSSRVKVLSSNVEKYGRKNIIVINQNIDELVSSFPETFSKIILDAPCSGSGMIRKEEKMKEDWSLDKVKYLASIQKDLIVKAFKMLKEGGELIYSTCSYSYEEDEEVILYLLSQEKDAVLIDLPRIEGEYRSSLKETIHLLPSHFNGEGHFIAKIKKQGELDKNFNYINVKHDHSLIKKISKSLNIKEDKLLNFNLIKNSKYISNVDKMIKIPSSFHVLREGLILFEEMDKGYSYHHSLSRVNSNLLPKIELSLSETIDYLYGLTISLRNKDNQKKLDDGFYILTYLGIPFALGKVVKNVIKNHFPKGLRVKTSIL